jgi:hypothetical protein
MPANRSVVCRVLVAALLVLSIANAQENVDGYNLHGRGSCQDQRGKVYSYLQRIMTFPNAETCGRQECERFGNLDSYRGFEFSVSKRCTCLFDVDEIPAVANDPENPQYVSKTDNANGWVSGVSGRSGTFCYGVNAGFMTGSKGGLYAATLFVSAALYFM